MPIAKRYHSNAQRQAAYRCRTSKPATQAQLAILARSLQVVVTDAVSAKTFPLPVDLAASTPEETLGNLIYYFDPVKDPVRYPHRRSE